MRYTDASCRQCRREGTKLFLKATKCFTEKCPVERRPTPPGQHGSSTARRRKMSEYSKQLREKQKIKRIYGVSERQFRNTFERVAPLPGITGHNLLAALESQVSCLGVVGEDAAGGELRDLLASQRIDCDGGSFRRTWNPSPRRSTGQYRTCRRCRCSLSLPERILVCEL